MESKAKITGEHWFYLSIICNGLPDSTIPAEIRRGLTATALERGHKMLPTHLGIITQLSEHYRTDGRLLEAITMAKLGETMAHTSFASSGFKAQVADCYFSEFRKNLNGRYKKLATDLLSEVLREQLRHWMWAASIADDFYKSKSLPEAKSLFLDSLESAKRVEGQTSIVLRRLIGISLQTKDSNLMTRCVQEFNWAVEKNVNSPHQNQKVLKLLQHSLCKALMDTTTRELLTDINLRLQTTSPNAMSSEFRPH